MVLASSRDDLRDPEHTSGVPADVVWHDLECGRYRADLALWRELAGSAPRAPVRESDRGRARVDREPDRDHHAILDVGAGTGRVALDLARAGHRVTALERDPVLLCALSKRARGTTVRALAGDARELQLRRRDFALCIVAMQTIQLLGGAPGRGAFLARARAHLRPGGLLACAIVTELEPFDCAAGDAAPSPETARVGGTVYISRATRVRVGRRTIEIERKRLRIPAGHAVDSLREPREKDLVKLDRVTPAQLHREGRAFGLSAQPTLAIAPTDDHVGSAVVVLRA